ncbi:transcriptional regulator [Lactobacillus xylocopicola]|uniref:Transcriptional regulator n=2 Tax=Lactobacillus xylocopicola TaxID=2976676 RepID=A0ABN6SI36_9LACO|nr:transcriptional regulator [Lactobacillus xylocopicola]
MVVFTERQRKILLKLIENKKGLSLADLEQQLAVSQRTLYREFADLRLYLEQQGVILINRKGLYQIEGSQGALTQVKKSLINQKKMYYFSTASRQDAIVAMLLLSCTEMKINDLALNLEVSQVTVQRDLDDVAESLEAYGLHLLRKKGIGIIVSGPENIRRYLFCRVVLNEINEYQFLLSLQNKKKAMSNFLALLIPTDLLVKSYEALTVNVLPEIKGIYDQRTISLVLMFALTIYRFSQGCNLSKITNESVDIKYLGLTYKYLANLNYQNIGEKLPKEEVKFLAVQLQNSDHQVIPKNFDDIDLSTSIQIKEFISLVSTAYGWDFTRNPTFFEKSAYHIESLLKKNQLLLPEANLASIKILEQKYQKLANIIAEKWQEVFTQKYLSEYEKQLLLLYFANECENHKYYHGLSALVICENGFSTSQILKSRLQQEVPEISQIDTTKIAKLKQLDLANYDLVLTTVDLPGFPRDYQVVSPLLLNNEVKKIKKYLKTYQFKYANLKKKKPKQPALPRLLAHKKEVDLYARIAAQIVVFKFENTSGQLLKHIINGIVKQLPEEVIADAESVAQKLLYRINLSPVGLPHTHLALVHTSSASVHQADVTVCELQIPVKMLAMDRKEIEVKRFLIMLAPEKDASSETQALGMISSMLVMNNESMAMFENGTTKQLQEFLADKFLAVLEHQA